MGKIAILHFSPPELYPPLQNFIRVLEQQQPGHTIYLFTTAKLVKELDWFRAACPNIRIIRLGKSGQGLSAWQRALTYCLFYLGSFFLLLAKKPARILYYETISSFPAWLYRRFFNQKVKLLIHYHEYTSPDEYQQGMVLTKWFHQLEKSLYPLASWVSHTNSSRMELFKHDIRPIQLPIAEIVPNYPPRAWGRNAKRAAHIPLKIVYVGSLGLHSMYTREFAHWVKAQQGRVTWDIYAYNIAEDAQAFLHSLNCHWIKIKKAVNYQQLPVILEQYDVGIILYNGQTPNYIFNAPNKLFEYLACGLDVWYPAVMVGVAPYKTKITYPKVLVFDFMHPQGFDLDGALSREGHRLQGPEFCSEEAFALLAGSLCNGGMNAPGTNST